MALITRTGTDFQTPEEKLPQQLKQRIDSAVNALAQEHYLRLIFNSTNPQVIE
jgi:hypothetical protein